MGSLCPILPSGGVCGKGRSAGRVVSRWCFESFCFVCRHWGDLILANIILSWSGVKR